MKQPKKINSTYELCTDVMVEVAEPEEGGEYYMKLYEYEPSGGILRFGNTQLNLIKKLRNIATKLEKFKPE